MNRCLLAAATLALGSCAAPCTEIGCSDEGLTITLTPSEGWNAGVWQFEGSVDDVAFDCQINLPVVDLEALVCGPVGTVRFRDGVPDSLFLAGDGYDDVRLTLRLLKGGSPGFEDVATLVEAVDYDKFYPNGEQCPPGCDSAQTVFAFETSADVSPPDTADTAG
jgi:hypothetical protein